MSLVNLLFIIAIAAPFPATSTSAIINSKPGLFISKYNFQIHADNTDWQTVDKSYPSKSIIVEYRPNKKSYGVQPSLTVRVDEQTPHKTLKSYMRESLKEYSRFGFKTLTKKPFKINGQAAYLVDLYSQSSQRQLRQVIFLKENNAVILTCRAHRKSFNHSVKDCNQIIRNFKWTL